jgi:predicted nucleic acid-binding protein
MTVALDSNVLLYAELEPDSDKGVRAADVILRTARMQGIIPVQALGEFLRVVQRRAPARYGEAVRQTGRYAALFSTSATTEAVLQAAAVLAERTRIQLWDAVIVEAARAAGAHTLLSEDLQDGQQLGGVLVRNPFALGPNALDGLLPAPYQP